MRIQKLLIENYKVFKGWTDLTFPNDNSPIIFVGKNGSGKSSIIDAIIACLTPFYFSVQGKKIKQSERLSSDNINRYIGEHATVVLGWTMSGEDHIVVTTQISENEFDNDARFSFSENFDDVVNAIKSDVSFYKKQAQVPLLVYYPVERTVINHNFSKRTAPKAFNQLNSYIGSLDNITDYSAFFEWFKSSEDVENEIRLNTDNTYTDVGLSAVRKAILSFLDGYSRIRVKRIGTPSLVLERGDKEFDVSHLSHGEKAIIALVGDLARRLVIANPLKKDPLSGSGIVLIDEIDLHLHPTWQRTILDKLQFTFKEIQFICTTHSSLIINHNHDKSIFVLEDGKCINIDDKFPDFNTYGASVEDILTIVQGSKKNMPDEVSLLIDKLNNSIRNNDLAEAKILVQKLKSVTDPNQPDIRKAETRIKFKELTSSR